MYVFLKRLWDRSKPIVARYFWVFIGYFLSQVGVQILNLLTGFAIVRNLSKDEYAIYTIINTLGPVLLILSDNGIGNSIMALGRQFWQDNDKMGSLVNTGLRLRRTLALFSLLFVGPLLVWMLHRNHAPVGMIALLSAAVVVGISFQMTSSILRMVLELRQHIKALGKIGLASAALRLALVAFFIAVYHLNALLAILAVTCSAILEASYVIHTVKPQLNWHAPPDPEYRKDMLSLVKKTLPLTIYFCVQSQVSIWLISIFGSAHQVADIGSTMRLGVLYTTLTATICVIMLPRFARTNGRHQLHTQLYQILGVLFGILVVLVAFSAIFPQLFILLLGEKYGNMSGLIWLVIFATGLGSIVGIVFSLNMSKGWVPPAYLIIPVEILTQIILLVTLDLSKTPSVLVFGLLSALVPGVVNLILLLRNISREPEIA